MREAALRPVWKRKFIHTTDSRHDLPVAENLLESTVRTDAPNHRLGIGYHLCAHRCRLAVSCGRDRLVLAQGGRLGDGANACHQIGLLTPCAWPFSNASRCRTDRAFRSRQPIRQPGVPGITGQHGIRCSMSRKGNCWDNAVDRTFLPEPQNGARLAADYANHGEGQRRYYRLHRWLLQQQALHSTLGNLPPAVYERKMAANTTYSWCPNLLDHHRESLVNSTQISPWPPVIT